MRDSGGNTSDLEHHWDSWITEDDFRAIAGAGLNTVRIPVGCELSFLLRIDATLG